MPITPENKKRYPKDWKQIRAEVLDRAGNACEGSPDFPDCRIENYSYRNKQTGEVTSDPATIEIWELVDGHKVSRIVLTIGHLDHTPENNGEPGNRPNLKAWCQRCHLNYDADHHAYNSRETRIRKLNNLELPLEVQS